MSIKKAKEVAFTFRDVKGEIRAVHVQLQHFQEGNKDRVKVIATSDGVPVEADARVSASANVKVKTKTRF